jgi:hypothetical protein
MTPLVALAWLFAGVLWFIWGAGKIGLWDGVVTVYWWVWQRRRTRLDDRARYRVYRYTDPETGRVTIGLELVTPDARMIDDIEIDSFAEGVAEEKIMSATERAMRRMDVLNAERTPERMRMYRIREAELEEEEA